MLHNLTMARKAILDFLVLHQDQWANSTCTQIEIKDELKIWMTEIPCVSLISVSLPWKQTDASETLSVSMASLHTRPTRSESVCKTMTPSVGRTLRATVGRNWNLVGGHWMRHQPIFTSSETLPYNVRRLSRKKGARSVPPPQVPFMFFLCTGHTHD